VKQKYRLEFLKELLAPQLRDWRMHGTILGLSISMAGFGLVLPGFVRWIIDDLVGKSTSPLSLTAILYVLLVAILLQAGMFFVREYSVGKAIAALTRKMSLDYLDKVTHTRVQELSSWGLGDLLTRFSDVSQIQGIFTKFLVETSFGLLLLCGTALFVGWKAKEFLWLLVLPTPAMFVVIRFLHPQLRIAERLILDRAGKLHSYLISVLESARTIHSSQAQGLVLGLADTHLRRLVDAQVRGQVVRALIGSAAGLVPGLGQVIVLLVGAKYVKSGALTLGDVISASTLLTMYYSAWISAMDMAGHLQEAASASYRLRDIYGLPRVTPDGRVIEPLRDCVAIQGLGFSNGRTSVLENVDLQLRPGRVVAVTGAPGAGKSTLLNIIAGLYHPSAGQITWDGTPYHDIQPEGLGRQIALMTQEPQLINATILDNLLLGKRVTSEEVAQALLRAGALDWIQRLPHGIYTVVGGEGNRQLSPGQKQVLGWARMLLHDASVFLFDEPTSSVDAPAVQVFVGILQFLRDQGCAVCVVSHDPSVVAHADERTFIEAGRIHQATRFLRPKQPATQRGGR